MNIYWKLFTNTNNEEKTKKLINSFIKVVNSECNDFVIEPYHKGGFVCSCSTPIVSTGWSERVIEALIKAQAVGRGWILNGNIKTELDAWSNESVISGIENMQMCVELNA